MRGSPLRELLLIAMLVAMLAVPLRMLTRGVDRVEPEGHGHIASPEASVRRVEAWFDVRLSHAPASVRILQDDEELMAASGGVRLDGEGEVRLREGRAWLRLEVVWPEAVEQGYAEMTVEPDGLPGRSEGVWGAGTVGRSWEFLWEEAP